MPRPRTQTSGMTISPGQATYVLERLVAERRISPGEIYRYLTDINREISSLEQRLSALRGAAGSSGGGAAAPARRGRRRGRPPGRPGRPGRPPGKRGPGRPPSASTAAAAAAPPAGRRRGRPPGGGKKRRAALTPEQAASRQLQGRYLGLIRQIPANKRGQYQKTAKEKGREAAIKEMQETLKK